VSTVIKLLDGRLRAPLRFTAFGCILAASACASRGHMPSRRDMAKTASTDEECRRREAESLGLSVTASVSQQDVSAIRTAAAMVVAGEVVGIHAAAGADLNSFDVRLTAHELKRTVRVITVEAAVCGDTSGSQLLLVRHSAGWQTVEGAILNYESCLNEILPDAPASAVQPGVAADGAVPRR
jgi:hypothetical protein